MTQNHSLPVFDWFANQFTIEARSHFLEQIGPVLTSLFQPGDCVLDLCCGAGAISFFLEDQGAQVTGIDLAPKLVAMAKEEAAKRGSRINFIHGNVLTDPLGDKEYDLVVCFGNAILDFPPRGFPGFRDKVRRALKPAGRFVVQYRDGVLRVLTMSEPREVIEEGAEGQIKRSFREYDPVRGAYVSGYHHLATDEYYEYSGYVYTGPLLRVAMDMGFYFDQSIRVGESSFVDIFVRN